MPGPAAAAGWLLALLTLGLGLSLSAEQEDPGFSLCGHSFYRQTPPVGLSSGGPLSPLCHWLPGGQAFATLYSPTCDTAVCSAFHLGPGWGEGEVVEEGEAELGKDKEEDESSGGPVEEEGSQKEPPPPVGTPALLLRDGGESSSDSWDSLVSALLQDSVLPRCSSTGGDLYVLTGSGEAGAVEGCQAGGVSWSAACCAAGPEGESGFSVALIRETEGGERVVSVKELEEAVGATELFSGGCEGTDEEKEGGVATLLGEALVRSVEKQSADRRLDITDEDLAEAAGSSVEAPSIEALSVEAPSVEAPSVEALSVEAPSVEAPSVETLGIEAPSVEAPSTGEEQVAVDATPEEDGVNIEEQSDGDGAPVSTEPLHSSDDNETLASDESDTMSESLQTVIYIITSSISLLTAPLQPLIFTIAEIPGQVTYVLQEDLDVLTALPGDTFSLFHLVASDLASGFGSAKDLLVGLGEACFSGLYSYTSVMAETLLSSCQTGVTGTGTLARDGVGILGRIAENAWSVTSYFGGWVWEQGRGYVGAVVSEMGQQVEAVCGGVGTLVWQGWSGVGNVVMVVGGLVVGRVEKFVAAVNEAFGQDSGDLGTSVL